MQPLVAKIPAFLVVNPDLGLLGALRSGHQIALIALIE